MKILPSLKLILPIFLVGFLLLSPTAGFAQNDPLPCFGFGDAGCDPNAGETGSTQNNSQSGSSVQVGNIDDKALGIPTEINDIIGSLIQLIYAVAGIIFFFMLLLGGIRYLTAGGDEKAVSAARNTLQSAFIGLLIVVAAFVITQLLFNIFNIKGFIQLL